MGRGEHPHHRHLEGLFAVLLHNGKELLKEDFGLLVPLGYDVTTFTPAAYQRCSLQRPSIGILIFRLVSHLDAFSAYPFPT